ncbi:maleylpyruvate isomerase family mycothiol-dependent enzyme [Streptomyces sp. NPDC006798]|uniref:maleylpyruvate isomerase family mycothiol-dependent enzyme n=1 Tax=Streptomyces sp. NPDC006798 TaxID=3155462 RepID=UPI00340F98F0
MRRTRALPEGLGEAIRTTGADVAALLRSAVDPAVPVPGLTWTLGDTAAHLAQANALMADIAAGRGETWGDGTPGGLAGANARALAGFPVRAPGPLAAMITDRAAAFVAAPPAHDDPETPLTTPLGPMNRAVLGSYLLTHMLGHGFDIGRALRRPHMIDRARVELCLPFLHAVMPRVVHAPAIEGLRVRYAHQLRGGSSFGVTVADGVLTVLPGPLPDPDCVIRTDPVTFLLMSLGRCSPARAMARGHIVPGGPRPWLAPRFPGLFRPP